ncbi:membrane-associated phospholipid phosphatase [Streptosporangium becharense]|uniref:Membrane-associated phospholipid phosphatase n=1 Tax=Streptosporangium becharense TaxID=1816182 RepID=A0A7W9IBF2_9ACTN|nr:hypothetical protein [Streptosporangium becharense]MBB2910765.1 membrane-associated phospholipid phosphatase [Streptosporangium becharense]MBB5817460.1 membrane-associated phospholipid phosphatase [Streptosporangium becharense]
MSDRPLTGERASGPRVSGGGRRAAWMLTDVFAPQYVALALPVVAGGLSGGWAGAAWGLLASAVCAGVPAAVIAVGVRRGRLDSMHVVDRAGRTGPMLAGLAAVVAGLVLLVLLGAPLMVTVTAAVMLGWIVVLGSITLVWKISFHTGVSAGAAVVLAHVLPAAPTLAAGAVLVAVIGWARVRVSHHTPAQVTAGAITAAAVAWGVLLLAGVPGV